MGEGPRCQEVACCSPTPSSRSSLAPVDSNEGTGCDDGKDVLRGKRRTEPERMAGCVRIRANDCGVGRLPPRIRALAGVSRSRPAVTWGGEGNWTQRERIARVLREYDSQGNHRTGSAVDAESGRWLAEQVRLLGGEPVLERMPFSRIDIQAAYLEVDGRSVQAIPLFDGGFTGPDGVSGSLGAVGTSADIGVVRLGPRQGAKPEKYRRKTGHRALVVVTGGEAFQLPDGLALFNADSYKEPFGPPTLQVGSESWPWLEQSLARGARARVVAHVSRRTVEVFNVTAEVTGTRPGLDPLIVMTPRSGWWNCASERGCGIAIWLELVRELERIRPTRNTFFVASTGHELGHYGLGHHLSTRQSLIKKSVAWIHLGANLGAAVGANPVLQVSDDELKRIALEIMAATGNGPAVVRPVGTRPRGEARAIHDGGGRYISLLGESNLFHHPHDRWPIAVDLDAVVRFATMFVQIGIRLTAT